MGVEVKICGMTNRDDVVAALDYGADYIGFVLYAKSARGISVSAMQGILDGIGRPLHAVGVFVNEPRGLVEQTVLDCGLHAVQIQGHERSEDFADFPVPLWRSLWIGEAGASPRPCLLGADSGGSHDLHAAWPAERYVVEAAVPGMYGGTGVVADWNRAAELAAEWPVMLAGGLTPDNVEQAIGIVNPLGVDVSSGIEAEPGRKDHDMLKAFVGKVKQ